MSEKIDSNPDPVASLVRLGGPRTPVPEPVMNRSRTVAKEAWMEVVQIRRRRRRTAWAIAAGLTLLVSLPWWLEPWQQNDVEAAEIVAVTGSGLRVSGQSLPVGSLLSMDTLLETSDGLASLRLADGTSLRLDSDTRLNLLGDRELRLDRGSVYLDVGDGSLDVGGSVAAQTHHEPRHEPLAIHTPFGIVRDIGTQFEIRLRDRDLRVRVRDGEVEVEKDGQTVNARKGAEITLNHEGELGRATVPSHGEPWKRYQSVAEPLEIEGASLSEYLQWLVRETGWTLVFSPPEIAREASTTILHGSLFGASVEETPLMVLPICGLEGEWIDDGLRKDGTHENRLDENRPGEGVFEIRRMREEIEP